MACVRVRQTMRKSLCIRGRSTAAGGESCIGGWFLYELEKEHASSEEQEGGE